ncbi:hypothetical protein KAU11_11415 [Candidatus Babeliales bacterium]|nr:hypothetical protein [Candidatus Babeliales bacterium]
MITILVFINILLTILVLYKIHQTEKHEKLRAEFERLKYNIIEAAEEEKKKRDCLKKERRAQPKPKRSKK